MSGPGSSSPRRNWVLIAIAGPCILIEVFLTLGDMGLAPYVWPRQTVYEYAGFWPGLLAGWNPNYSLQPYAMFVTYAFLHNGIVHMAVNMVTLYSLGAAVLQRVGLSGFAILYLAAILGGGLGFGLLADTLRPMVGASGGLFGLAGGILAWNYVDRYTVRDKLWPVAQGVVALLLLNLVLWWLMDGLLAWETHLGGFLAGWVTALLIDPRGRSDIDAETDGDSTRPPF